MIRTLTLAVLLSVLISPANAAERITVAQLEQKLATPSQVVSPPSDVPRALLQDSNLAIQIDNVQLSERLTPATLERIQKKYALGPHTQRELLLLADRSALLDPPASELPDRPAPDAKEQKKMIEAVNVYLYKTLTHLPNFFATRTTERFFGIPPELNQTGLPVYVGLHPKGSFSREITYRDGKEVIDPMKVNGSEPATSHDGVARWTQSGLESWGEFGPEPAVILMDADNGTMAFHHWEKSPQGVVAVYRFSVPAVFSHYEVNYSCNYSNSFHTQPSYHGSLAIDSVTGAILRITLQADSRPRDPISHVASVIEYGPVEIGGRMYICPLRSLAFSVEESDACSVGGRNRRQVQPMQLNRTTFSDYHRLGSTSRIITDPAETKQNQQAPEPQR